MSIHPQYADAILAGTKRVEFRKRRLAPDVSTVVIYATRPVGRIVGTFEVHGHDIAAPEELWNRHSAHAGISATGFRAYYAQTPAAVGILIGDVRRLPEPRRLADLPGVSRPPQSFSHLSAAHATDVQTWVEPAPSEPDTGDATGVLRPVIASFLAKTVGPVDTTVDRLRRAI
jgi:predicted transcriptional regulator